MGIALIIVGGLVLMTVSAAGFDYLAKRKRRADKQTENTVALLEERLANLEAKVAERDERISQLESDVSFVSKLIEDKTR